MTDGACRSGGDGFAVGRIEPKPAVGAEGVSAQPQRGLGDADAIVPREDSRVTVPGYMTTVPQARLEPGRSTAAPRLARHALGDWLATIPCSDTVTRDAQLVVSELITNAILHTHSAPTVVASYDDGRLRIEVHDHDRAPPRIGDQADASGGWGLRLVDAVTDGWGWNPTRSGKHVWTEILC
jgi:anti-sigma regulatory factor (Ser/Thr protein kinase)